MFIFVNRYICFKVAGHRKNNWHWRFSTVEKLESFHPVGTEVGSTVWLLTKANVRLCSTSILSCRVYSRVTAIRFAWREMIPEHLCLDRRHHVVVLGQWEVTLVPLTPGIPSKPSLPGSPCTFHTRLCESASQQSVNWKVHWTPVSQLTTSPWSPLGPFSPWGPTGPWWKAKVSLLWIPVCFPIESITTLYRLSQNKVYTHQDAMATTLSTAWNYRSNL